MITNVLPLAELDFYADELVELSRHLGRDDIDLRRAIDENVEALLQIQRDEWPCHEDITGYLIEQYRLLERSVAMHEEGRHWPARVRRAPRA